MTWKQLIFTRKPTHARSHTRMHQPIHEYTQVKSTYPRWLIFFLMFLVFWTLMFVFWSAVFLVFLMFLLLFCFKFLFLGFLLLLGWTLLLKIIEIEIALGLASCWCFFLSCLFDVQIVKRILNVFSGTKYAQKNDTLWLTSTNALIDTNTNHRQFVNIEWTQLQSTWLSLRII